MGFKLFTGRLPSRFASFAGVLLHPSWTGTVKTVHKSVNKAAHWASHTNATRGNSSLSSSRPSARSSRLQVRFNKSQNFKPLKRIGQMGLSWGVKYIKQSTFHMSQVKLWSGSMLKKQRKDTRKRWSSNWNSCVMLSVWMSGLTGVSAPNSKYLYDRVVPLETGTGWCQAVNDTKDFSCNFKLVDSTNKGPFTSEIYQV